MTQQVATRALVVIDGERCKQCGWCIEFCPQGNLRVGEATNVRGHHPVEVVDQANCTGCGQCALVCPDICIEVYRARRSAE